MDEQEKTSKVIAYRVYYGGVRYATFEMVSGTPVSSAEDARREAEEEARQLWEKLDGKHLVTVYEVTSKEVWSRPAASYVVTSGP